MGFHIALGLAHVPPPSLDLMSLSGSRKVNQGANLSVTHEGLL
jgi:hypothetical protein